MRSEVAQGMFSRPGTLAEVVVADDEEANTDFATRFAGFLNMFYADSDIGSQRLRVEAEPVRSGRKRLDAYMAATAEHLCRRWLLGTSPVWVEEPCRFLDVPWFTGSDRMRPFLLRESPSAFRRRLIFTESEPLRRALMPRDGRWWHYEGLRTGMMPEEGDIVSARAFR